MDTTLSSALESGPFGDLEFLLHYGSGHNDVDILAVYTSPPLQRHAMLGRLDCFALCTSELVQLIVRLDPAVTEPLLNGRLVAGSTEQLAAMRSRLTSVPRSRSVVRYLVGAACASYQSAEASLTKLQHFSSQPLFRLFWKNMAWTISYLAFAAFYDQSPGTGPVPLVELLPRASGDLRDIWRMVHVSEGRNGIQPCEDALSELAAHIVRSVS